MQTSILLVVTQDLASVVTGMNPNQVSTLTTTAERLTLLSRREGRPRAHLRYHPLVQEFLEARLVRDFGVSAVRDLHRRVARYSEVIDWRTSSHHHWMAGDRARAYQIIEVAASDIVAKGEYALTEIYLAEARDVEWASFEVLRSRHDFKHGDVASAVTRARRAVDLDPRSS